MKLILVRHAQSTGNAAGRWQGRNETDLSEPGREQAKRLKDRFISERFEPTHVYSSPMIRTYETARIATDAWEYPIIPLDDLIEIDVGIFSGKTWEEVESEYPELARLYAKSRNWDHVPEAESMNARRRRAKRAIHYLITGHLNTDKVVAFTHGGIMLCLFAELMDIDRMWGISVGNTAVFDFDIDLDQWYCRGSALLNTNLWRINRFNDTTHLC